MRPELDEVAESEQRVNLLRSLVGVLQRLADALGVAGIIAVDARDSGLRLLADETSDRHADSLRDHFTSCRPLWPVSLLYQSLASVAPVQRASICDTIEIA